MAMGGAKKCKVLRSLLMVVSGDCDWGRDESGGGWDGGGSSSRMAAVGGLLSGAYKMGSSRRGYGGEMVAM